MVTNLTMIETGIKEQYIRAQNMKHKHVFLLLTDIVFVVFIVYESVKFGKSLEAHGSVSTQLST